MTVSLNGTSGLTFPDSSTQNTAATGFGFKNRIINGAMMIDQRNAGASVTPTATGYTLDRWQFALSQTSKFSVQQNAGSAATPVGFTKYLGATVVSAYAVSGTDFFTIAQNIEGLNIADLAWGTASAASVTLSFKVYSSLTGTFGGAIRNGGATRSYPFTYTISSPNTWTSITITIAGDASGTWATDNSTGISVIFGLGVGSTYSGTAGAWAASNYVSATGATSVVGTNGAKFYITGVQLEKGSTATSFDYRPYGTELALCQRYYWQCNNSIGTAFTAGAAGPTKFPVTMRSAVTMSNASFSVSVGSAGTPALFNGTGSGALVDGADVYNSAGNFTVTAAVSLSAGFSAEL